MDIQLGQVFRTHLDVLERCFDVTLKVHRRATYCLSDTEMVWFPKLGDAKWENELRKGDTEIWEKIPDEEARLKAKADRKYRRYTFLKEEGQAYRFVGVFEYDYEQSNNGWNVYKRVATTV